MNSAKVQKDKELFSNMHIKSTLNNLNVNRKNGKNGYLDLKLTLPNKSVFDVHRVVISGCEYFRSLLEFKGIDSNEKENCAKDSNSTIQKDSNDEKDNPIKDSTDESGDHTYGYDCLDSNEVKQNITLDREISDEDFEKIINFIYTGRISVTIDSVMRLLDHAIHFNLLHLKDKLTGFSLETLTILTVLPYWRQPQFNATLNMACMEFIGRNCKIFLDSYLSDLTFNEMDTITKCEEINCSEENLYFYILKWLNLKWSEREIHLPELFNNIRFISISRKNAFDLFFSTLEKFRKSEKNSVYNYINILYNHLEKYKSNNIKNIKNNSYIPRIGFRTKDMFAITNHKIYNLIENKVLLNHLHGEGVRCTGFGKNYLLLSGGTPKVSDLSKMSITIKNSEQGETKNEKQTTKFCNYYCSILNKIECFPEMNFKRSNHGLTTMNNVIYACGGVVNSNTMEMFDFNKCSWYQGAALNKGRHNFGITTSDNCIYIIGGYYDKHKTGDIGTIERFDPRENKWVEIFELPEEISNQYTSSIRIEDSQIVSLFGGKLCTFDIKAMQFFEEEFIEGSDPDRIQQLIPYGSQILHIHNGDIYFFKFPEQYKRDESSEGDDVESSEGDDVESSEDDTALYVSRFCIKTNKLHEDIMKNDLGRKYDINNIVSLYQ